jgi:hypothetical protein
VRCKLCLDHVYSCSGCVCHTQAPLYHHSYSVNLVSVLHKHRKCSSSESYVSYMVDTLRGSSVTSKSLCLRRMTCTNKLPKTVAIDTNVAASLVPALVAADRQLQADPAVLLSACTKVLVLHMLLLAQQWSCNCQDCVLCNTLAVQPLLSVPICTKQVHMPVACHISSYS